MNKIWFFLMLASSLALLFTRPDNLLPAMMEAGLSVVELCLEFCAIYSIWMGLLEILEQSGLSQKLSKILSPIIKKLFKTQNKAAIKQISISLSANILGLGNTATPSAIIQMRELDNKNGKLNFSMLMFMIISSCSIQALPTTVISLRQNAGSENATDIILPTLIATFVTTTIAILVTILYGKLKYKSVNK